MRIDTLTTRLACVVLPLSFLGCAMEESPENIEPLISELSSGATPDRRLLVTKDKGSFLMEWHLDARWPSMRFWRDGKPVASADGLFPKDVALAEGKNGKVHLAFARANEIVLGTYAPAAGFTTVSVYKGPSNGTSTKPFGVPSLVVDDAGAVLVAFGGHDASGQGMLLARCAPATSATCTIERITTEPNPDLLRSSLIASGGGVLLATTADRSCTARVLRKSGSAWSTSTVVGGARSSGCRVLLAGDSARSVLAVTNDHEGGSFLFELKANAWKPLATLPVVRITDVRLDEAKKTRVFARRRYGATELWKAYSEADGFADRGASVGAVDPYYGHYAAVALGPEGDVYASPPQSASEYFLEEEIQHHVAAPGPWIGSNLGGAGALSYSPCLRYGDTELKDVRETDEITKKERIRTVRGSTIAARKLIVPAGTTLEIGPGSCVVVNDLIVKGTLRVLGTKENPVHFVTTSIHGSAASKMEMSWAFLEDSPVEADLWTDWSATSGASIAWDHVSTTNHAWASSSVPALQVRPTDLGKYYAPIASALSIRSTAFGPLVGHAIGTIGPVTVDVKDTGFRDVLGAALNIHNAGANGISVVMERATASHVGAFVRMTADPARRVGLLHTYRKPELQGAFTSSVRLDHLDFVGGPLPTPAAVEPVFKSPVPAFDLAHVTGSLTNVSIAASPSDGVRFLNPGNFTIDNATIVDSKAVGIAVNADPPAGLGPCEARSPGRGDSLATLVAQMQTRDAAYRDPIITNTLVARSGLAGIEVSGPHIPMQVSTTRLHDNGGPGFAIRNGRQISPAINAGGCYRLEALVTIPLSPLTTLHDNELIRNGGAGRIDFVSDHQSGSLPARNNYWDTTDPAVAAGRARCTGVCSFLPIRTQTL